MNEYDFITAAVRKIGSQSDSAVDVRSDKKTGTRNGTMRTDQTPIKFAGILEKAGAGEFIIDNIDWDGIVNGYDLKLVQQCRGTCNFPMTVMGGADSLDDIKSLIKCFPIVSAAAGSLFAFKGKYRAVLINYPYSDRKEKLSPQAAYLEVS